MKVIITPNLSGIEKVFARFRIRAKSTRAVFASFRAPFRADIKRHGRKQEGPKGRWPALSKPRQQAIGRIAANMKRLHGKRARTRKPLGRLPTALQTKVTSRDIVMASRLKWSSVHQYGGVAGRGAKIPQRQFLWVSPSLHAMAARRLALYVAGRRRR